VARSDLVCQATAASPSPPAPATGRGRAVSRDQADHRRPVDLWLSPSARADPATPSATRWRRGQLQMRLAGYEGAPAAARAHTGTGEERRHRLMLNQKHNSYCKNTSGRLVLYEPPSGFSSLSLTIIVTGAAHITRSIKRLYRDAVTAL